MKFTEKKLEETADVSAAKGKTPREFASLAITTILFVAAVYFGVGILVNLCVPMISPRTETKLFSRLGIGGIGKNGMKGRRYREILDRLAKKADMPDMRFSLIQVQDRRPNAFAMPGGTIGLTSGLMKMMKKEDDAAPAFVIGHELGHFKHRDHLRGLGRSVGARLIIGAVFGSSGGDPLSDRTLFFMNRRYSRAQEEWADRFGLRLVYEAYGRTNGTTRLFDMLKKEDKNPQWAYMFSTHPSFRKRLKIMKKYSAELEKAGRSSVE